MSKIFLSVLNVFFVGTSAFAWAEFDPNYDYTEVCKEPRLSHRMDRLDCLKAKNANSVRRATVGENVKDLPETLWGKLQDVFTLKVLPDADTGIMYSYNRKLLGSQGETVGYLVISGYQNSEMGVKLQLNTRYDLSGELAGASLRDLNP